MATTNLDFILQAQDKVSGQIKTINSNLQNLNGVQGESVKASGNAGGAFSNLKGKVGELSGGVSGLVGQFALGNLASVGIQKVMGAISGTISDGLKATEDWQTQQARANAQTKQAGTIQDESKASLVDLSEATSKHTAVSREAVLTGVNMLDTFGNISGKVLPAATDAMTRLASATNGGVIPSAQQMNTTAIQLGIALNDPATAYTRLRREGVTFTAQQKEQLKAMVASGDTMGAQKLLIGAIDAQYASLSSQQNTYKFALAQLHNTVNDFVGSALKKLGTELQKVGTFLLEHKPILAALAGALLGLGVVIGVVVVTALWGMVSAAVAAMLALWPIVAVGAAIGLVAYEIVTHWSNVKQWFNDFINWIKGHWVLLVDIMLGPFGIIITTIITHLGTIKNGFNDALNFITGIWGGVSGFFTGVWDGITRGIRNAAGFISGGFRSEFNQVATIWNNTLGKLHVSVPSWVPGMGGKGFDFPTIPTFAGGTQNFQGGLAIVGEQGAELVDMPQGTQITPAGQTSQLLNSAMGNSGQSSQTVNMTISIGMYAGMPSEKRQIAVDLYTELVRAAKAQGVKLPQIRAGSIQ